MNQSSAFLSTFLTPSNEKTGFASGM
jgi:hypothetical protein